MINENVRVVFVCVNARTIYSERFIYELGKNWKEWRKKKE